MIRITEYRDYFKTVQQRLGITTLKMISGEAQIISFLRDLPFESCPVLVLVIPSSDTIASDEDNIMEPSTGILFLLSKVDTTMETEDTMVSGLQVTQDYLKSIKELMRADKEAHDAPHLLHYIDFNRLHTDPEINLSGCNGWSLSFIINSPGF